MPLAVLASLLLLAQGAPGAGTIASWVIWVIVIGGLLAIGLAVLQHFNISPPPLLGRILWIVIGIVLAVAAVRLVMSLI